MKRFLIFPLLAFLIACAGKKEANDPIDFEDLAGETGVEEIDSSSIDTIPVFDENSFSGKLKNAMKLDYSADTSTAFHPMDRYSFNKSEKMMLTKNTMVDYGSSKVSPKAEIFYYTFSDTNATKNAFYNYLDDLSANGESGQVKLNEDMKSLKTPPVFMMVYDTLIVSAQLACEHKTNDWRPLKDSILSIYGNKYSYFIDIQCGGPLKWR